MIDGSPGCGRRQHDRAGAVAEEDAGRAVGVVDDARHHVGADDERVVVRAAGDHLHAGRQRVGEARTRRAEVESPGAGRADLVLQHARRARKDRIGRRRADDDEADVGRRDARLLHRAERGFLREIGRRDAGIDDVALADAGALENPLVRRLDELLEIGVRQDTRRHVGRQAGNLDRPQARRHGAEAVGLGGLYHKRSFAGAFRPKYS